MAIIRINDLPDEDAPSASDVVALDGASTRKADIVSLVDAARPFASQGEAEAGVIADKSMSPLTTKQAFDVLISTAATIPPVEDVAALQALNMSAASVAYLREEGREGIFTPDTSDLSATLLGSNINSSAVDDTTDTITSVDHGLTEGQAVVTTTAVNGASLNTIYRAIRPNTAAIAYDAWSADFTVGQTLTGGTSLATATIDKVVEIEADDYGILWLSNVSGTFQDNEPLTDPLGGSAQSASAELSIPNTDKFQIAASYADAVAGTQIDLTGTDPMTFKRHFDPRQGFYVTPTSDITGASGAWVRQADRIDVDFFGPTRVRRTAVAQNDFDLAPSASVQTDNTDAVNCAFDFLRSIWFERNEVHFGPYLYHVNGAINATEIDGMQGGGWALTMTAGGCLCSSAGGEVAVDFSGSRFLTRHNFTVIVNPATPPRVGVLDTAAAPNRDGTGSCDYYNDTFTGVASVAGLYVDCQEISVHLGGTYINGDTSNTSYAAVVAANNPFDIISPFAPDPKAYHPDERANRGMVQNAFIRCSFRKSDTTEPGPGVGGGPALYMQGARGISFPDCYFLSLSGPAQIIVNTGGSGIRGVSIKGHFELAASPRNFNVRFIGDDGNVRGFDFETPVDNVSSRFLDFNSDRIEVTGLRFKGPLTQQLFNYSGGSATRTDFPSIYGLEVIDTALVSDGLGSVNINNVNLVTGANLTVRRLSQLGIPSGDEERFDGIVTATEHRRAVHYRAREAVTIASGIAVASRDYILLTGEGSLSDQLDTFTLNGAVEQEIVTLHMQNQITIGHATGNIRTLTGSDAIIPSGRLVKMQLTGAAWNLLDNP